MKLIYKIIKFFLLIISLIVLILLINYARINILYYLNKSIYKETFNINGNSNKYVPQGLTYSEEYDVILQTSYNSKHKASMLYITDFKSKKLIKELKLKERDNSYNYNHVGGIATDNNKVWITNNYEIDEYSLREIINTKNNYIKSVKKKKLLNRGDFCLYHNNILWVGDFFLKPFYNVPDNNPLLIGYNTEDNINFYYPNYIISLPKMVQGIAITDDNKFILTSSFTNLINSNLSIYNNPLDDKNKYYYIKNHKILYYKFTNNNLINNLKIPPMAEGIFYKDNYIYVLFENSSDKYYYAYPKIKKILKISIKELDN